MSIQSNYKYIQIIYKPQSEYTHTYLHLYIYLPNIQSCMIVASDVNSVPQKSVGRFPFISNTGVPQLKYKCLLSFILVHLWWIPSHTIPQLLPIIFHKPL